ncbi:MAG TPA: rod shape-determining protein, partial [Blastocatellia bacterium]|nr:rod shape-determining protein [Blastocatellia bacterium]
GVRLHGSGTRTSRAERVEFTIESADIARATDPSVQSIVDALCETVRNLPVLTSCEIIESGICLTGGGARLRGMVELLAEATSLDVRPAADPLHAVINGARKMLSVGRRTGFWVN